MVANAEADALALDVEPEPIHSQSQISAHGFALVNFENIATAAGLQFNEGVHRQFCPWVSTQHTRSTESWLSATPPPARIRHLQKIRKLAPIANRALSFLTLRDFFSRRDFIKAAGATALAAGTMGLPNVFVRSARAAEATAGAAAAKVTPETLVKQLYKSLKPEQKSAVAFAWDHVDSKRGLLRTHVSNNWNITDKMIASDFYSKDQQDMIRRFTKASSSPIGFRRSIDN